MKRAAKMPPYVWARPETHVLWFRMSVPKKVRAEVGKSIWQCSLGTTDIRQAAALAQDKRNQLLRDWGLLPDASPSPANRSASNDELEGAAVLVGYDMLREHEAGRRLAAASEGGERWRRYQRRTAINLSTASDREAIRSLADAANDDLGFDFAQDSEAYAKLCEYLASARHAALDTTYRIAHGEAAAEPEGGIVARVRDRAATKAKPGENLLELFEKWAADKLAKGEKRADTVNQDRKVIEQFAEFFGTDRAIDSITRLDVKDYRNRLRELPPKWKSHKSLNGLDMRQAAAKARELGLAETAFTTVNKHLSTLSPLFKWIIRELEWETLKNPCDGQWHEKVKGKNPRPPFTTPVLNKILQSPLFAGFLDDDAEHKAGNRHADDWRKWIPLVCMFTGARIGEIAQLRIGDIRQEHGVWFVHIAHEGKLSTKSGKSRPAAVHSRLESLGFLDFVERQRVRAGGDGTAPLFPELKPNSRGQISGEPSRWWRDYLAAIGVKQGADGIGAHSFRHELADRLRVEARLLDNEVGVCLGHSIKSTPGGYGEIRQGTVTMLKDWIEAVRWKEVDFSKIPTPSRMP
jgi:integrase